MPTTEVVIQNRVNKWSGLLVCVGTVVGSLVFDPAQFWPEQHPISERGDVRYALWFVPFLAVLSIGAERVFWRPRILIGDLVVVENPLRRYEFEPELIDDVLIGGTRYPRIIVNGRSIVVLGAEQSLRMRHFGSGRLGADLRRIQGSGGGGEQTDLKSISIRYLPPTVFEFGVAAFWLTMFVVVVLKVAV